MSESPSVAELLELVARQAERIAQLEAEIAELKRRLGQNSSNSSVPPSADGLAKPAPKSLRGRSGRRPGGQAGHAGRRLSQVDSPDETVVLEPVACHGCGAGLAGAQVASVTRRQVFDVPPIRVRVVEHRLMARRCGCGTVTTASAPAGVAARVQYGSRVKAIVVYLMAGQFLAQARCAQAVADLFGIALSEGTVAAMTADAASGLSAFTDAVRTGLHGAALVHADETGLRVDGRLHWVHSTSTDRLSLITVHAKRGRLGIDAHGVLPDYRRRHVGSSQRQRRLRHTSFGRRPPTVRSRGRVVRLPFDRRARVPHSGHLRACSSAVTRCTTGPTAPSSTPATARPSRPSSRVVSSIMPVALHL